MRILITHTDLDGLGSAIIAIADKLFDRIYCWNNDYVDKSIFKGNTVVVTDLSIDIPNATIYDHHETSKRITNAVCDLKRCGTKIFYEEYVKNHNSSRDRFVHLIDVYDRWQNKNVDFKEALDLARLCEHTCGRDNCLIYNGNVLNTCYSKFINQMIDNISKPFKLSAIQQLVVKNIKENEDKEYTEAMETLKVRTDCKNNKFAICTMSKYITQNGNRYLMEHSEIIYILIRYKTNSRKLSARAVDGFNLNSLKGLAGHPKAAGGTFSQDFLNRLENGFINELGYK